MACLDQFANYTKNVMNLKYISWHIDLFATHVGEKKAKRISFLKWRYRKPNSRRKNSDCFLIDGQQISKYVICLE